MVSKHSLLAFAGAVLLLGTMAPLAMAQTDEAEPDDPAATSADASPSPSPEPTAEATVEVPQTQLDSILAQLAALTLRVEALETALAEAPAVDAGTPPTSAAKPKAPVATGETERRFTVRDPNPDRGLVTWRDRAKNEDGYRIYARRLYCGLKDGVEPDQALDVDDFTELRSEFVRVGKAPADATRFRPVHQQVRAKLPPVPGQQYGSGEIYELYATAFNEAGESKRVLVGTYITTPEFLCP